MALMNCTECNKEVADSAPICPNCGYTGNVKDKKKREQDAILNTPRAKVIKWIMLGGLAYMVYSCVTGPSSSARRAERAGAFDLCVLKGEKYFRGIGSWPILTTGEKAADVAIRRCQNTTGAFGE
jgi:predicted RNA-binding Zn-ribbon protein involved in translation (DUF1610 family)